MKILFVDLGRAGKLFSTGRMFEEKLHESSLNDVEVTTGKHSISRLDAHYSQTYLCAITK